MCVKSWANVVVRDSHLFFIYTSGFFMGAESVYWWQGCGHLQGYTIHDICRAMHIIHSQGKHQMMKTTVRTINKKTESSGPVDGILFWIWTLPVDVTIYKRVLCKLFCSWSKCHSTKMKFFANTFMSCAYNKCLKVKNNLIIKHGSKSHNIIEGKISKFKNKTNNGNH